MDITGWVLLVAVVSLGVAVATVLLPRPLAVVVDLAYALFFLSVVTNLLVGTPLIGLSGPGIVASLRPPVSVGEVAIGAFVLLAALGAVLEEG